ncbi:hypothetical protein [Clostridium botulinum]|uniref:hypothetical protein n=1 Tax=Clostridium botulinum TaxID=1491 RepID=UPI0004DA2BE7|nr:hypothetical protein [Clostridium botulinum]KEH90602.1 hypothetical protein Z963_11845 [Clostridium botulinum C/D str. It1]
MSKKTVSLSLVEMFAIKHGLQMQLVIKENDLRVMEGTTIWEENLEKYKKLKKDVAHEKKLVKDFELYIKQFKEKNNIK